MEAGTVVVVYLVNPKERYWGFLRTLDAAGVTMKGLDIHSFEDWCRQTAADVPPSGGSIGLTTMFFPAPRIEKVIADEASGGGESMRETFERITGARLEEKVRP